MVNNNKSIHLPSINSNTVSISENLISIVTICFNNLEEVIDTCKSVDMQQEKPYEHLIIDGSSNDEIKKWLEGNHQPVYRKWQCERDEGIADAFNKGVLKATGNIINFMNSGDSFYDDQTLLIVKQAFDQDNTLKWLHGAYILHRGGIWITGGTPYVRNMLYKGMRQISHQSMYVKKEMFEKHGLFRLQKKVAMDYDFLVRIRDEKSAYLAHPLCKFAPDGTSYDNMWEGLKEVSASYQEYVGFSIKQHLWRYRAYLLFWFTQKTKLGKLIFQLKNSNKKIST